ncbi:dihydrofolate reductase family protein [Actinopolymorpha sp. B11F2]|uniref:dihydrofolate reductase family protein n=1 Tax=Actinopolymorpha sp. B11F2 TaxID=3160862 RepID=UPI0032E4AC42
MAERPYVVASAAMSVDGCLDDTTPERLLLSDAADFDRVDEVRSGCDAILVGAETIRRDNPRLVVRSDLRRQARLASGRPADPVKVTLTASGELDPGARFFAAGESDKVVYAAGGSAGTARERLGDVATVVDGGDPLDLVVVLADLIRRGVRRLLVEGGGRVHTAFLTAGFVDELHLVVAPFFVGDADAPRFVGHGAFPHHPGHPMRLADVRRIGDLAFLRYVLAADHYWLAEAIEESRRCPVSPSAYSVGAVLVDAEGQEISRGYSREADPRDHAEEAALAKVADDDPRLRTATLYSTLEPCSARASRPRPCAELVIAAGIPRVVIAWREPDLFVDCHGVEDLRAVGVEVLEKHELASEARSVNAHLFRKS